MSCELHKHNQFKRYAGREDDQGCTAFSQELLSVDERLQEAIELDSNPL